MIRFKTFRYSLGILIISAALCGFWQRANAQIVEIPDPSLEQAIREKLGLSSEIPITELEMLRLRGFAAEVAGIENITGLEYAKNLKVLILNDNPIQDLTPLSSLTQLELLQLPGVPINDLTPIKNLTQLKELSLAFCGIRDISPLANLTQLIVLILSGNDIVDVSPLANLTALEELWLDRNHIVDLSPVQGLSLTDFRYDEVCVLPALPIQDRLGNRSLPSIFQLHGGIVTLPTLSHADTISEREDHISYHDLFITHLPFGLRFTQASPWSQLTAGNLATGADLAGTIAKREELLAKNPNMLFLAEIRIWLAHPVLHYPEDWFGWVRDEHGNPVSGDRFASYPTYLIDIRLPEVQDIIIEQAISVAACGLYDGIFFDGWWEGDVPLVGNWNADGSPQFYEIVDAEILVSTLQRIRANVRDDFLIMFNSNRRQMPNSVSYINGSFMETFPPESGYTRDDIIEIEGSLIWYEANVREPKINCLRGLGIGTEPPDSPKNRQWMRLFTTMSLTLSNGYALYTLGHIGGQKQYQKHIWHAFWDADLGQPVGPTAQRYQDIEGLYIREFTNGWAVYNRSGNAQTITLPIPVSPASPLPRFPASSISHLLPDLDGEIYLKIKNPADVNGDWVVNILDLVQVANGIGKSAPDPNGDGIVNILDLVFVAGMFGTTAAAPSAHLQASEMLTAVEVRQWLTDARSLEVRDPIMKRGIMILEQLLVSLTPKETELLSNFPNPFNPETWIPYRLAKDAFVTLTIYDLNGRVVRRFDVGHQIASAYESRSKAIYWDGTNELGERVASGVYFYHLSAGDYSATRRMLVIK